VLAGAESKDPGNTYLAHAVRSFSTTEPAPDIRAAIAMEKQLKGWRRAKRLSLIRTINPEFKDLEQTRGWKILQSMKRCTRDHQVRIAADPAVGLPWSKSSEQHG
jgi:hypothetical protein